MASWRTGYAEDCKPSHPRFESEARPPRPRRLLHIQCTDETTNYTWMSHSATLLEMAIGIRSSAATAVTLTI